MPATSNRRWFLTRFVIGGAAALLSGKGRAVPQETDATPEAEDARIFRKIVDEASTNGYAGRPIGEVMGAVGLSFIGTPYVAHSLEVPGDERLVVNLRAFDCTTFMESVLTLSRCIRARSTEFSDYERELQNIRYHGGVIDGYSSRLHYFTGWLQDNQEKQIVRDVTRECGGERDGRVVNYMTTHTSAYRQLTTSALIGQIQRMEQNLTASERWYIPKARVETISRLLQTGDIIGITTAIEGLDVAHVGLVVRSGGKAKFLHAPLSGSVVTLTSGPLSEYLMRNAQHTGILVARPLDPHSSGG